MQVIGFVLHAKIQGKKAVKASLVQRFGSEFTTRFYETTGPRTAEDLSEAALRDGCDFIISVGGDGTLNEVVNGFLRAGGKSKFSATLGVMPFGTGNDFARGIGMQRSLDQLEELIHRNQPRFLDAGSLSFTRKDGSSYIRYFDNIADLGIGAQVVAHVNGVHLRKKILGGFLTFFLSVLFVFVTYRHKKVRVRWGDQTFEGPVLGLVAANGRYFGSGFGIAPDAKLDDGQFELVIFANVSVIDYIRNFSKLRKAERIAHPEVHYYRTDHLWVEPDGQVVVVEADGEIEGQAPLEYRCLPGALPFLVP